MAHKNMIFNKKEKRIQAAGCNICPYTGQELSGNGEIDHIIPRESNLGTLNDEANLIYASVEGNKKKGKLPYSLAKLSPKYKRAIFNTDNDVEIEKWIVETIDSEDSEYFSFGRYNSFINLTPDEQKAFRHALFLIGTKFLIGNKLQDKVINAINNRNRAIVNGTQRYFADVIAHTLYQEAKKIGKENLLDFDYFGIESQSSPWGDDIYDIRKKHEKFISDFFGKYKKENGKPQLSYSHLIDAQLAFAIAASNHRNHGGLGLNIPQNIDEWPFRRDTGEIDNIFMRIHVPPQNMQVRHLQRRKPSQKHFVYRQIHRDSMYAERYVPILVHKESGEVRLGFDWENSCTGIKDNEQNRKNIYFALSFNAKLKDLNLTEQDPFTVLAKHLQERNIPATNIYFYISLSVRAIHTYYIEHYNTALGYKKHDDKTIFLRSLAYRTKKERIDTLDSAQSIVAEKDKNFQISITIKRHKLILPVKREWEQLVKAWEKYKDDPNFLKEYFKNNSSQNHEKIRQHYSLPIQTGQGQLLIRRRSWNGKDIYQIHDDSDSRSMGTKKCLPAFVRDKNNKKVIGELLSNSAKSKNIFILENKPYFNEENENVRAIDPRHWYPIDMPEDLTQLGITQICICVEDNTRPLIRLTLARQLSEQEIDILSSNSGEKKNDKAGNKLRQHKISNESIKLLSPRDSKQLKEKLQKCTGGDIEYKGKEKTTTKAIF